MSPHPLYPPPPPFNRPCGLQAHCTVNLKKCYPKIKHIFVNLIGDIEIGIKWAHIRKLKIIKSLLKNSMAICQNVLWKNFPLNEKNQIFMSPQHTVKIFYKMLRKISGKSCFPGPCGDLEIINTLFKRLAFLVQG